MRQLHSIMLVDDDSTANFLHKELLKDMKVTESLIVSMNGEEALDKLQELCASNQKCPDLILLDINMPKMDGFEFLEAFNQISWGQGQTPLVMMLTSSINPADLKRAQKFYVSEYLSKPLKEEAVNMILSDYF